MNINLIDRLFSAATYDHTKFIQGMYHPYIPLQFDNQPLRFSITQPEYHKFAQLIAEECAKICAELAEKVDNGDVFRNDPDRLKAYQDKLSTGILECANFIRQKFEGNTHE